MAQVNTLNNPWVPMGPNASREIWVGEAIKPRTKAGRSAGLRIVQRDQNGSPYPGIRRLAHQVMWQAMCEAEPTRVIELTRPRPKRITREVLHEQFAALAFLTEPGEDLAFWCHLAGHNVHCIRHRYQALLSAFLRQHPEFSTMPVSA